MARAVRKELRIITMLRFANNFPTALALLEREIGRLRRLVTHRFPFERIADAMTLVHELGDGVVKAMIEL
jgi:threonine dehydrogenase-like Zn-dependent dehydrogenase